MEFLSLWGDQPISGTGNALNNFLWGNNNPAPNVLAGGAGNERLHRRPGRHRRRAARRGHHDRVFAYVDYTLPDHVENLVARPGPARVPSATPSTTPSPAAPATTPWMAVLATDAR